MKLKLTYSELVTLLDLYSPVDEVKDTKDYTVLEKLLFGINVEIFERLRKIDSVITKKKYSLSLKPFEAIAFYLYWSDHPFPATSYSGNLLNSINNNIH